MAELIVHIPNATFRRQVVEAMYGEPYEAVLALIVGLVENMAADPFADEELRDLVATIKSYIPEE